MNVLNVMSTKQQQEDKADKEVAKEEVEEEEVHELQTEKANQKHNLS